ncbi:CD-NTase associated protein 4-like DNA endonuclease domain-containing protein [Methylorubrum thiocyanatum]
MATDFLDEIVGVFGDAEIGETGGGHGQKGVEYQRNWAIVQMLVLEEQGATDFLFLFEAIQDIAILDSSDFPTKIDLYQIKKKDRGEWSWAGLTKLHQPPDPTKKTKSKYKAKPLTDVANSPLGKLHSAVHSFNLLDSSGRFVSNAGCDIAMADGSNAATSLPVALASLPAHLSSLLTAAFITLHKNGAAPPDLSKLVLEKADLPVDSTSTFTIGKAHAFLAKRSPKHAGQSQSFVDSLLAKIGPLGTKTAKCSTFEEMKSQHGYTRDDFIGALGALEGVIDIDYYLNAWLLQLQQEGMGILEVTSIRAAVAGIYRRQVMGKGLPEEVHIASACDEWLLTHKDPPKLMPFFKESLIYLLSKFPFSKPAELQAHFALRAINKCVAPN